MSHKSVQSNSSHSFGSSGTFNVSSGTKVKQKEGSNSSISMVNPFNSLRMFIKPHLKDAWPILSDKRRMMARNYLKDDFMFKEVKRRKSLDRGSLLSVITQDSSGEKTRNSPKSDSKDEKKTEEQKSEKGDLGLREDKKSSPKEDGKDGSKDGRDAKDAKPGKEDKPEVK